jgi:hypothetical protein
MTIIPFDVSMFTLKLSGAFSGSDDALFGASFLGSGEGEGVGDALASGVGVGVGDVAAAGACVSSDFFDSLDEEHAARSTQAAAAAVRVSGFLMKQTVCHGLAARREAGRLALSGVQPGVCPQRCRHHAIGDAQMGAEPCGKELEKLCRHGGIAFFDTGKIIGGAFANGIVLAHMPLQQPVVGLPHHALFVDEMILGGGQ